MSNLAKPIDAPPDTRETWLMRAIPALTHVSTSDRSAIIGAIEDLVDAARQQRDASNRIVAVILRNPI